ncbi:MULTISPECIES: 30S ribosomal protein S20 [Fusobacterium]|uniref:Small ribosomal subunit protein bS20 n=4 Tax=Fusobacterium TaxID=848 RepID=A0A377GY42_9FUSO|nr:MULTISPECIES: 30S ribosomal protein S20 [Fusobacterium]MBU3842610.1 30S ribosomal protein S20 [Candidatus Fusobacterium pullicola]AVQ18962.1 30S ribosomal protein S20 [Fusobacterium mortiferum ATCC 9817]EEO35209.1 ribosomal protein S20 [Fusobacterium mortiferum ATCC 9817]MBM6689995.1 30S ribosomal protein S20 [Fusobacterium mortiferum]MBM6821181.1 30S ribosomal protein S20 [Fusobacterium mortiferum]
MAHSRSAKKRVLIAERNRERNQAVKSRVKTMVKKVLAAVEVKEVEAANAALSVAYKELDKAVTKGIIKKNTASRKKARLAAKVNAL